LRAEISLVEAAIAETERKTGPGPLAKALKESMLDLLKGEKADLQAKVDAYENRIGTLRGDLTDVDRILGVTSEKANSK
jgi:hypothetical protein